MAINLAVTIEPVRSSLGRVIQEGLKYFFVSVAALFLDYGLLIGLTRIWGIHYLISAAIGFCAGSLLNYALSVTLVFNTRSISNSRVEFVWFCVVGIFGLLLNEMVIALVVNEIGVSYVVAKVPAAALSFLFNFSVRRWLLFNPTARFAQST